MHSPLNTRAAPKAWTAFLAPAVVSLVAASILGGGVLLLIRHLRMPEGMPLGASSAVVLALLAAAGGLLARLAWKQEPIPSQAARFRRRLSIRWALGGLVVSYGFTFLLPPPVRFAVFAMTLAGGSLLAVVPLSLPPRELGALLGAIAYRPLRAAGWTIYVALMLVMGAELVLRVHCLMAGHSITLTYATELRKLPPGLMLGGREVNSQGYWDEEFQVRREPGLMRIAVVGDRTTLGRAWPEHFLSRIERTLSGVEVYNFGLADAGPRELAAQTGQEVMRYQPDVVLAVVSVDSFGANACPQLEATTALDCRSLCMYQLSRLCLCGPAELALGHTLVCREQGCRQDYLTGAAAALAVCRTPIPSDLQCRWQETFGGLEALLRVCRQYDLPAALVVSPCPFQVNEHELPVLRRRAGYARESLDLTLPQRRMLAFAKRNRLPIIDLLPHLRSAEDDPFELNSTQLSADGHAIVAGVLSRWLEAHLARDVTRVARAE